MPRGSPAPSNSRDFHRRMSRTRTESEEGLLVRAADLIGQLGDPHYLRKANALVLRVRRSRDEQAARLYLARRPHRSLSAVLLEQHVAAHPDRHPLSQCDVERTAMDRKPLQQHVPRRTRSHLSGRSARPWSKSIELDHGLDLSCEHDVIRKSVSTFRDHALGGQGRRRATF